MIFAPLLFLIGLAVVIWAGKRVWFFWQSRRWPCARGIITRSEVSEEYNSDGPDWFVPHVEYLFSVTGREIAGRTIRFGISGEQFETREEAQKRAEMFPVGATVDVWHHPNRPTECVLERKIQRRVVGLFVFGTVLSVSAVSIFRDTVLGR